MTEGNGMLAWLGNVVYRLFTDGVVLFVIVCVSAATFHQDSNEWWQSLIACVAVAIVFWGTGRAARYILAGR